MWSTVLMVNTAVKLESVKFWDAVHVSLERPNILNRRVIGAKQLETVFFELPDTIPDLLTLLDIIRRSITSPNSSVAQTLQDYANTAFSCHDQDRDTENFTGIEVRLRLLLPKSPDKFSSVPEIVVLDKQNQVAIFSSVYTDNSSTQHLSPSFAYKIWGCKDGVGLDVLANENTSVLKCAAVNWLRDTVLPKIAKWATEENLGNTSPSLKLIKIERYSALKHELKVRYGQQFVKMWPECTDPYKFVYEDIAIAAYLLALWEAERKSKNLSEKQSFVDLGCGNGLLVHLLASEGHPGIGLDIRKRAIWQMYGENTKLVESTITPSDSMLFPKTDWIIGNHSDELTPWIPLIAARSSFHMRVFLLPCCTFTFDGKYQRTHSGSSRYQSYLNFIEELCHEFGFHVKRDKLRIPSTKRVCFVCMDRNYDQSEECIVDVRRTNYMQKYSRGFSNSQQRNLCSPVHEGDAKWSPEFQPREKVELVRNCTQLERTFLDATLNTLVALLLASGDKFLTIETPNGIRNWRVGGSMTIKKMAKKLSPGTKKELKHQCGGLQTLLRNHRNIFRIKKDLVSLSTPLQVNKTQQERRPEGQVTLRQCWHFLNHPDGCPLANDVCSYVHEIH